MRKISIVLLLAAVLIIAACAPEPTPTPIPPTNTPTLDYAATEAFEATESQMELEAKQTEEMAYQYATETAVMGMTETEAFYATATREMEMTNNKATSDFMRTEAAGVKQTETAVYEAKIGEFMTIVEDLASDGYITNTEGTYYELEDVEWELAKINWFQPYPTSYSPTDFVLTAHIDYAADSDKTNWFNSGCGFIFRADDDYYTSFITMDGWGEIFRVMNNGIQKYQYQYYGLLDTPAGEVDLMLVVENTTFRLFINGKLVLTYSDVGIAKGDLYYALKSGTNAGFGTRCSFTDVILYELAVE